MCRLDYLQRSALLIADLARTLKFMCDKEAWRCRMSVRSRCVKGLVYPLKINITWLLHLRRKVIKPFRDNSGVLPRLRIPRPCFRLCETLVNPRPLLAFDQLCYQA